MRARGRARVIGDHETGYRETVTRLEALGIMPDRAPSLEPMREALARLGLPARDPARTILVAGTNGKGSVCAALEALLLSAGESVGLYTSPHLVESTERFRIQGADISRERFCRAYESVRAKLGDLVLTHFEMLTAMAAWLFFSGEGIAPVQWAILEVGLGGTWDATNAIPHGVAVIASLGKDHENLLGDSLVSIAANKFGVIGPGMTVVHQPLPAEVRELAARVRLETGSRWLECEPATLRVDPGPQFEGGPRFELTTRWGRTENRLAGARGALNAATALTAFSALGFDPARHLAALGGVRWPGRMQSLELKGAPCPVYLSGDHNPQGIASLLELLAYFPRNRLHILAGVGKDKDCAGVLAPLYTLADAEIYLTETPFRGRPLAEYGEWLAKASGAWADPGTALAQVLERARAQDLVLVTGSLYLVGAIQALSASSQAEGSTCSLGLTR